ncbi:type II restriction endonuclease [Lentibacillus salinarum]|uniref:Type II restriction endonuclease n=1 Tax=Lentibacillus salinarum TaxID=446820 RepID=A0ABW3ZSL2_9BACI
MKKGFLSQYFEAIVIKRLSAVEVDTERSNQHEFNGTGPLKNLFGSERLNHYPVTFVWLGGDENEAFSEEGSITWYDARESNPARSAEWRLYFSSNGITDLADEQDLLIVARRPDRQIFMFVVQSDSTFENQLLWLFDIEEAGKGFNYQAIEEGHNLKIDFAARRILEEAGIDVQEPDAAWLDSLIEPYIEKGFPTTREFSRLAEASVKDCDPINEPDLTLMQWVQQEEKLFKRLERYIVKNRLEVGFTSKGITDVDGFVQFSLSVHNRRKSRAGHALENHLQRIFQRHDIKHSRGNVTEEKYKPDFLFPDIQDYRDAGFPSEKLTMLGVKSTLKDRWRQVLAEAARIETKHLLTLEPGISESQTSQMKTQKLNLILPQPLHETFKETQRSELMDLSDFLTLVKKRQSSI